MRELAKERKTTKKGPGIHYVFTVEACYCDKVVFLRISYNKAFFSTMVTLKKALKERNEKE